VKVFIGSACVLGPTLVIPLRTLWDGYQAWCAEQGFEAASGILRETLDNAAWAEVIERPLARGRLKTIVQGVGMRPRAQLMPP
jgi:hypothetical protein